MNKLIPILVLAAILAVAMFFTVMTAFKGEQFTCSKFILNTYLYILLSFIFLSITVLLLDYFNVDTKGRIPLFLLGSFFITILCIIGIYHIKPKHIILKHLVWLLCIASIGFGFYPIFEITASKDLLTAFLTMVLMVVALSVYAFMKPDTISLSWGPGLFFALTGCIIFELISLFIVKPENRPLMFRIFSLIFIVIFSLYLLYDTKRLQIDAKNCGKSGGPADYIKESFGIFYDMYVLFIQLLSFMRK